MPSPSFLPALMRFWSAEGFDPTGATLVLGVSGGADSVALLELCAREVVPRFGCALSAVHVNHGLRADAALDEALVAELCAARGVPLRIEAADPSSRRRGQSVEMWGRERRYEAFARAVRAIDADTPPTGAVARPLILTAHHRDDVVETLCLRLARGTGIAGLEGIPFRRTDGVVRPLLPVPRAALRAWLRAEGVPWREDATNADARVPRNWVRHRLLPAWRAKDPEADERLFRAARAAASLRPAWERWNRAEHSPDAVRARGGIPVEWLRAGLDGTTLAALLRELGVARPRPELAAELLRQAAAGPGTLRARADETTLLTAKDGVLIAKRSVFKRAARA